MPCIWHSILTFSVSVRPMLFTKDGDAALTPWRMQLSKTLILLPIVWLILQFLVILITQYLRLARLAGVERYVAPIFACCFVLFTWWPMSSAPWFWIQFEGHPIRLMTTLSTDGRVWLSELWFLSSSRSWSLEWNSYGIVDFKGLLWFNPSFNPYQFVSTTFCIFLFPQFYIEFLMIFLQISIFALDIHGMFHFGQKCPVMAILLINDWFVKFFQLNRAPLIAAAK